MVNELSLGQPQLGHDCKSSQYVFRNQDILLGS